jgi:hypothetical protein
MENEENKYCYGCSRELTYKDFHRNKSRIDNCATQCIRCTRARYMKRYRTVHREELIQASKNWHIKNRSRDKQYKTLPEQIYQNYVYRSKTKKKFKELNLKFELTMDEFLTFWAQPCYYCNEPILTISIDRVNSNQGYTLDNCVSCCSKCNTMKMAWSKDESIIHMRKILNHLQQKHMVNN